jgi:lysozyme family protein
MADFLTAYKITISENEGGYNPGISEKETYKGIDRGANPYWNGWRVIDVIKQNNPGLSTAKMNLLLSQNIILQSNIEKFFKVNYWDAVNLDNVKDQQLANNLFDCAVNQGEALARKLMQKACNYVITTLKVAVKPLVLDKVVGKLTLAIFNSLPAPILNKELNAEREASYRLDKEYAEWGKVWERRLKQYIVS